MKQERNSEIDLLLRRMSGRNGNATRAEAGLDDQHLDADELSAFAEQALPPAARTRYMQHLAECTTCRKLATELSLSLGAATATRVEAVAQSSGWKKFLAGLLSPMVLRYAVPALGVIVVMVVGFVMLRRSQGSGEHVAQVGTEQKQPVAVAPTTDQPASGLASPQQSSPAASSESAPKEKSEKGQTNAARPADVHPVEKKAGASESGATTTSLPVAGREVQSLAKLEPSVAETPPPPAAPKAATDQAAADKKPEDEATKQPGTATETVTVRNAPAKESSREFRNANAAATSPGAGAAPAANEDKDKDTRVSSGFLIDGARARARSPKTETKRADDTKREDSRRAQESNEEAKSDTETRSIAGRQFRKERGIWVDTAYDSSTATVNMARGSEQFRALVADEPGIGTIAKQLDGEVIVVWKGHAYRIR